MDNNEYSTKDLALSTFLALSNEKGIKFLRVDRLSNREAYFVFSNPTLCESSALKYFSGTARVNPKDYSYKLRDFKGLLYETLSNPTQRKISTASSSQNKNIDTKENKNDTNKCNN